LLIIKELDQYLAPSFFGTGTTWVQQIEIKMIAKMNVFGVNNLMVSNPHQLFM
jgi:hypothetical protein